MDASLEEAAHDLGADHWQAFWRVTFPILAPGILAGALLAFTLSLDDFVITFFTAGVGTTTLPLFVYGLLKQRVPPEINAVSTLMILASIVLVGVSLALQRRGTRG
jgi:spermidine/putrescine transport system permease protein